MYLFMTNPLLIRPRLCRSATTQENRDHDALIQRMNIDLYEAQNHIEYGLSYCQSCCWIKLVKLIQLTFI